MRVLADHPNAGKVTSDLVGRDCAHVADVLCHHQVGLQREDGVCVDGVQRAALERGQRHRRFDRAALLFRKLQGRARDDGKRGSFRRKIAFMRDSDDLVAESNSEKGLRGAWQ
jgi:hypothetical protein